MQTYIDDADCPCPKPVAFALVVRRRGPEELADRINRSEADIPTIGIGCIQELRRADIGAGGHAGPEPPRAEIRDQILRRPCPRR